MFFKIPTYATFIASSTPAELNIGVTPTWDTNDILTVDEIVYYRLGSRFTVAAPLSSDTFTAISAQVKLRIIKSGDPEYLIPETLTPVIEDTTAKFTSTLKGQTQCVVAYAEGVSNPKIVFAAYDYGPSEYISEGERPNVNTKGVSPAVLSNNILSGVEWPVSNTPGVLYKSAAFLVQEETHGNLLPQVSIHVVSKTGSQLEIWDANTGNMDSVCIPNRQAY